MSEPSHIRNTTREENPMTDQAEGLLFLALAMGTGSNDEYIGAQEKRGQHQLVNSDRLPVGTYGTDADFLAVGFTFGEPDPDDPLFRPATLPAGWSRRATDHSMWSELVDQYGRKRVGVFYKAALYDRKAHMHLDSPETYLRNALYYGTRPVLDDEWLTLPVAQSTLEAIAAGEERAADEADDFAATSEGERVHWRGRAAEHRSEATKARALAESLGGES